MVQAKSQRLGGLRYRNLTSALARETINKAHV